MSSKAISSLLALSLVGLGLSGCEEVILNELDELRANKVKVILAEEGIEAHKIRAGTRWNIAVDEHQVTAALRTIESSRLLTRELARTKAESNGLFRSRDEKEQQIVLAISEELSRTIEGLPGVLEAHVHLFRPLADMLGGSTPPGSASVVAVVSRDCELKDVALAEIVAGATGIDNKRIAVELLPQTSLVQRIELPVTELTESSKHSNSRNGRRKVGSNLLLEMGAVLAILLVFLFRPRIKGVTKSSGNSLYSRPKLRPKNPGSKNASTLLNRGLGAAEHFQHGAGE